MVAWPGTFDEGELSFANEEDDCEYEYRLFRNKY